jgi:hypothetical protein
MLASIWQWYAAKSDCFRLFVCCANESACARENNQPTFVWLVRNVAPTLRARAQRRGALDRRHTTVRGEQQRVRTARLLSAGAGPHQAAGRSAFRYDERLFSTRGAG